MRLWHYKLIPSLPKKQLVSQWRECILIAKNISEKGTPNHILVNNIMNYDMNDFRDYCNCVLVEMVKRGYHISEKSINKLGDYIDFFVDSSRANNNLIFVGWHDWQYLKICMTNMYEKCFYANGKSKIGLDEFKKLNDKYKECTGENFTI